MIEQERRRNKDELVQVLTSAGAEIRGPAVRCPFPGHENGDKTPSGGIHQDEQGVWRYTCQRCGVSGDVFDIEAQRDGRRLAAVLQGNRADQPPRVQAYPSIEALRLAVSRGGCIEAEYRYTNPDTGQDDLVVFRLKTDSGKSFRQCHRTASGYLMKAPPKPWPLFNRAGIRKTKSIVVTEGEKAALSLIEQGICATTAPGGAGKAEHCGWGELADKRVVLWPDPDAPGKKHMDQVAAILEKLRPAVRVAMLDPSQLDLSGKEDAFDFVQQLTIVKTPDVKAALLESLRTAEPCSVSRGVKDIIDATISGKRTAVRFPWSKVSTLTQALLPHTVTVVCGPPGSGKSFFVLQALAYWHEEGHPVACFELEEDRPYHLHRALAQREKNAKLLDADWVVSNPQASRQAFERHQEFLDVFGKCFWEAPTQQPTLEEVAKWIEQRADEGCRIVVADPVTAAQLSDRVWVDDSKFVGACKSIVRRYAVSLVLVTHPRKGAHGAVGLDDLAGGSSYQRLTQTILWVERHAEPVKKIVKVSAGRHEIEINRTVHLCKTRNSVGVGLRLGFIFDPASLLFSEQGIIAKKEKS